MRNRYIFVCVFKEIGPRLDAIKITINSNVVGKYSLHETKITCVSELISE